MHFTIAWPDGAREQCYSPSLVIKDFFSPGEHYELAEFLRRSREALTIASDRVQAKFGFPCSLAMGQLARIEHTAATFATMPGARVTILSFQD